MLLKPMRCSSLALGAAAGAAVVAAAFFLRRRSGKTFAVKTFATRPEVSIAAAEHVAKKIEAVIT